jgi:HEPN domain-containing protein/predicted nucleotidyltransferase
MTIELAYPELTEQLLQEMVRRIRAVGQPDRIVLFGSRARGNHRPDSDVDLLIVEESDAPRHRRSAAYWKVLAGLFPEQDILVWTPREVAEWANVPNHVVTAALREGRTLFDAGRRWEGDGLVMHDLADHARGWLLKARSDLTNARRTLESDGPYDTACFHAQQAAEKAFKALLAFEKQPIPKTHVLSDLAARCLRLHPDLDVDGIDFQGLTDRGIDSRYDVSFWPDRAQASDALAQAERVYAAVIAALPGSAGP